MKSLIDAGLGIVRRIGDPGAIELDQPVLAGIPDENAGVTTLDRLKFTPVLANL